MFTFPKFTDKEIKEAFDCFDLDKEHSISAGELRFIFESLNEEVTDEEIDEMIALADKEGDGQVMYDSFYKMITGFDVNTDNNIVDFNDEIIKKDSLGKVDLAIDDLGKVDSAKKPLKQKYEFVKQSTGNSISSVTFHNEALDYNSEILDNKNIKKNYLDDLNSKSVPIKNKDNNIISLIKRGFHKDINSNNLVITQPKNIKYNFDKRGANNTLKEKLESFIKEEEEEEEEEENESERNIQIISNNQKDSMIEKESDKKDFNRKEFENLQNNLLINTKFEDEINLKIVKFKEILVKKDEEKQINFQVKKENVDKIKENDSVQEIFGISFEDDNINKNFKELTKENLNLDLKTGKFKENLVKKDEEKQINFQVNKENVDKIKENDSVQEILGISFEDDNTDKNFKELIKVNLNLDLHKVQKNIVNSNLNLVSNIESTNNNQNLNIVNSEKNKILNIVNTEKIQNLNIVSTSNNQNYNILTNENDNKSYYEKNSASKGILQYSINHEEKENIILRDNDEKNQLKLDSKLNSNEDSLKINTQVEGLLDEKRSTPSKSTNKLKNIIITSYKEKKDFSKEELLNNREKEILEIKKEVMNNPLSLQY